MKLELPISSSGHDNFIGMQKSTLRSKFKIEKQLNEKKRNFAFFNHDLGSLSWKLLDGIIGFALLRKTFFQIPMKLESPLSLVVTTKP